MNCLSENHGHPKHG